MKKKILTALIWTVALAAGLFIDSSQLLKEDVTLDDLNSNALAQVEGGAGNCTWGKNWLCQDGEMTYWDYYSCY